MSPFKPSRLPAILAGALVVVLLAAVPASAGDRVVKVRDACEPESFNAAVPPQPGGPPTCRPISSSGPSVTFDSFIDRLAQQQRHPQWTFTRKVKVDEGESVIVRFDRGGEDHTFTEVPEYGPGCVPPLNELMGFGAGAEPVVPCSLIFPTLVGPDHRELVVDRSAGEYRFMCLIHPWMRTDVEVRED